MANTLELPKTLYRYGCLLLYSKEQRKQYKQAKQKENYRCVTHNKYILFSRKDTTFYFKKQAKFHPTKGCKNK